MNAFKYMYVALMATCSVVSVQAIRPSLFFLQGLAEQDSQSRVVSSFKGAGSASLWSTAAFCVSGPPGSALAGTVVALHAAKNMHTRRQLYSQESEDVHKHSECSSDADMYDSAKIGMGLVISAASTIYIVRKQAIINQAIIQAIIAAWPK